ncbi:hypothetical protein LTR56_020507 [Elasticomyces elasticus]|uniref:ATP synthase subunit K, mitochondrial n=1 Tax=Elasticomyces elasticus TaxID=574655 RepID=A0AAN7WAS9_9PEZI|nr:hypothetical protein LTR22_024295 [Elasticomyces elasticus]KAK3625246.1 hypothetical protein LTR56_020507 [Elasticomyces elasticus]KAK4891216.1 hypothetical protein LTR27_010153 [Elasticomyces elasticus]KAK4906189.1 hypothetical protein LTR49_024632 [Elasticomyces elasticus]KAK4960033.1 hypothetical protein LTR10_002922 [Elasticomyces elasticus]
MVATYTLFGQKVGSHILAIATLGVTFAGASLFMGGSPKPAQTAPPIQASSKDEENFIQDFLKQAEAEEKKVAPKH